MATGILEKLKLPVKKIGEFAREANRRGVSTEQYLKEVVEDHLDRMKRIQNSTALESNAPRTSAVKKKAEEKIGASVDRADDDSLRKSGLKKRPTFFEVAKPIRDALGHLTDAQIDEFIDKARGPRHPVKKLMRRTSVR